MAKKKVKKKATKKAAQSKEVTSKRHQAIKKKATKKRNSKKKPVAKSKKQLTAKEKYDLEMKGINQSISDNNAPETEAGYSSEEVREHEEEVDALEDLVDDQEKVDANKEHSNIEPIDKHVGSQKITVTKQQFLEQKNEEGRKKLLNNLKKGTQSRLRLSPDQGMKINQVLELSKDGKLEDPVLKHLVGKKLEVAGEQVVLTTQIKEVQMEVVTRMGKLSEESLKNQGNMDFLNRDILAYLQKNPTILGE